MSRLISYLELTNYRGFERYRLSGLARVNLLVGKNNSGKTSILEAVKLLEAADDLAVLNRIAFNRGEVAFGSEDSNIGRAFTDLSHFFHGRDLRPKTRLAITTDQYQIDFTIDDISDELQKMVDEDPGFRESARPTSIDVLAPRSMAMCVITFAITAPLKSRSAISSGLIISEEGWIVGTPTTRRSKVIRRRPSTSQLITPDSLAIGLLKVLWDLVNTQGRQAEVVASMRILEPSLKDIFFLTSEHESKYNSRGGILASFEGQTGRTPLGSHGEGMRRFLALSLALVCTQGNTLLIDEIDTGLHYSIMGDLWRMVVETARRHDLQVFATTHSLDCVRGLAWLCEHHPELAEDVSLQKIDPSLEESVAFGADEIRIAAEQDIEVR
jgi:hypothetical protein